VWHKLYSSTQRRGFPEKAAKDQQKALVLGAVLADTDSFALKLAFRDAPALMIAPIKLLLPMLIGRVSDHPALGDALHECLGG
jgi:hypothetical protein